MDDLTEMPQVIQDQVVHYIQNDPRKCDAVTNYGARCDKAPYEAFTIHGKPYSCLSYCLIRDLNSVLRGIHQYLYTRISTIPIYFADLRLTWVGFLPAATLARYINIEATDCKNIPVGSLQLQLDHENQYQPTRKSGYFGGVSRIVTTWYNSVFQALRMQPPVKLTLRFGYAVPLLNLTDLLFRDPRSGGVTAGHLTDQDAHLDTSLLTVVDDSIGPTGTFRLLPLNSAVSGLSLTDFVYIFLPHGDGHLTRQNVTRTIVSYGFIWQLQTCS